MPAGTFATLAGGAPRAQLHTVRAFFFVTAPADPGLLPRLIEPVANPANPAAPSLQPETVDLR